MSLAKVRSTGSDIDIGIHSKARKDVAQAVAAALAETYMLQLKTQYYHWNVTGAVFQSLHTLFGTQYDELALAVDELAERIRMLGHTTPGTFREFAELSSLKEDKYLPSDWQSKVNNLLTAHEELARNTRERITVAQKAGDEGTADLFIKRVQEHEKAAWFLRSHL